MIYSLKTLRKADDLRLSSLASHLADQAETIKELQDDRIKDRKEIKALGIYVERLEDLVERPKTS